MKVSTIPLYMLTSWTAILFSLARHFACQIAVEVAQNRRLESL